MKKTLNQYLGLDDFDRDSNGVSVSHHDKYRKIVNALGYNAVKDCIPFDIKSIKMALESGDEHLNSLPISRWDLASGFVCRRAVCAYVSSPLASLYRKIGVNVFSNSEGVCVLKECARMWAEEEKENA